MSQVIITVRNSTMMWDVPDEVGIVLLSTFQEVLKEPHAASIGGDAPSLEDRFRELIAGRISMTVVPQPAADVETENTHEVHP